MQCVRKARALSLSHTSFHSKCLLFVLFRPDVAAHSFHSIAFSVKMGCVWCFSALFSLVPFRNPCALPASLGLFWLGVSSKRLSGACLHILHGDNTSHLFPIVNSFGCETFGLRAACISAAQVFTHRFYIHLYSFPSLFFSALCKVP